MSDAPERIYLDGDAEAGDGHFTRCFENKKYVSDPPIEYIRADLHAATQAKLDKAMEALRVCRDELDQYSMNEYPLDHPVHARYRNRDYDANPARIALAELEGK